MYDLFRDVLSSLGFFQTLKMAPGFRFFTVLFFSRARGARVQDFHWRLEGLGFQVFHYFSSHQICTICSVTFCRRWASFKLSKWLQGSGFSLFFFFHGLEGPVQDFHWRLEGPGFQVFHYFSSHQICTICSVTFCRRWASFKLSKWLQGSGFSLFFFSRARGARVQDFHWRLEGPGFRFFTTFRAIKYVRFVP